VYVLVNYELLKLDIGLIGASIQLMEEAAKRCDKKSGFFVYYNLSKIYDATRDRRMVEQCLRKALEYAPKHPIARHQLGVVVSRMGRYDEAIKVFDDLIQEELARDSGPSETLVYAYKTKIISLQKAGREGEARNELQTALDQLERWPYLARRTHELQEIV